MAVSGTRTGTNEYTLDGAANTGGMGGNVAYVTHTAVVEEFRIQTAAFDAATGYGSGAVVNVSLKSGTNELHGELHEFFQNTVLCANSFVSNMAGRPGDINRQNRSDFRGRRGRTPNPLEGPHPKLRAPRRLGVSTNPPHGGQGRLRLLLRLGPAERGSNRLQRDDAVGPQPRPGADFHRSHRGSLPGRLEAACRGCAGVDGERRAEHQLLQPLDTREDAARFIKAVRETRPDGLLLIPFKKSHADHVFPILEQTGLPTVVLTTIGVLLNPQIRDLNARPKTHAIVAPENPAPVEQGLKFIQACRRMADSTIVDIAGETRSEFRVPHLGTRVVRVPA